MRVYRIGCSGVLHRIGYQRGSWVLLDHDLGKEQLAMELGKAKPACLMLLEAIRVAGEWNSRELAELLESLGADAGLTSEVLRHQERARKLRRARVESRESGRRRIGFHPKVTEDSLTLRVAGVMRCRLERFLRTRLQLELEVIVGVELSGQILALHFHDGWVELMVGAGLLRSARPPYLDMRPGGRVIVYTRHGTWVSELLGERPRGAIHFREESHADLQDPLSGAPTSHRLRRQQLGGTGSRLEEGADSRGAGSPAS